MECYDKACHFLKARAKLSIIASECSIEKKVKAAVVRGSVLVTINIKAEGTLMQFESQLMVQWGFEPDSEFIGPSPCQGTIRDCDGFLSLESHNHIRFLQGYYRATSIIYLAGKTILGFDIQSWHPCTY